MPVITTIDSENQRVGDLPHFNKNDCLHRVTIIMINQNDTYKIDSKFDIGVTD